MVSGGLFTPYSTLCGVSLVAECGTNILFKKCQQSLFKTPFWGISKNQWLDPKVCADSSWLLVLKNGIKNDSSLINDQVFYVWSWCKKRDRGKGREGREGGKDQLGFRVLIVIFLEQKIHFQKSSLHCDVWPLKLYFSWISYWNVTWFTL